MTSNERRLLLSSLGGMLGRRPDVSRWERVSSFEEEWEERTRIMARLVPKGSRVIEFGAGRRRMAHHLDPSCTYLASDVIHRGPGTLVWDLNARPLPDLSPFKVDVAIFGGVLEYLVSLDPIARWLARHVSTCIASYECAETAAWSLDRLRERLRRARLGWVSTHTETELARLFQAAGFVCEQKVIWHTPTGDEPIFVFRLKTKERPMFRDEERS
jgi:hypothetical protein